MEDKSPTMSADSYLKTLKLVYFAFLSAQVLFVVAALLNQTGTYFSLYDQGNVYLIIAPALALAGFFGSRAASQKQLDTIPSKDTLKEKLTMYSSAFLVRVALLEAPTLFATAAFFLTGNLACLLIAGLMILYFLTLNPRKAKVEKDLQLSFQEKTVWDENRVIE